MLHNDIMTIMEVHAPEKVTDMREKLLTKYAGQEAELLAKIKRKYRVDDVSTLSKQKEGVDAITSAFGTSALKTAAKKELEARTASRPDDATVGRKPWAGAGPSESEVVAALADGHAVVELEQLQLMVEEEDGRMRVLEVGVDIADVVRLKSTVHGGADAITAGEHVMLKEVGSW